jgi:hypothetical protein
VLHVENICVVSLLRPEFSPSTTHWNADRLRTWKGLANNQKRCLCVTVSSTARGAVFLTYGTLTDQHTGQCVTYPALDVRGLIT